MLNFYTVSLNRAKYTGQQKEKWIQINGLCDLGTLFKSLQQGRKYPK